MVKDQFNPPRFRQKSRNHPFRQLAEITNAQMPIAAKSSQARLKWTAYCYNGLTLPHEEVFTLIIGFIRFIGIS